MGAYGYGIFDDDFAMDLKDFFQGYIKKGLSSVEAGDKLVKNFKITIESGKQDAITIFLVLASLQLENGAVSPEIKDRALEIIDSEIGLKAFRPNDQKERKKEYEELKMKLLA